MARATPPETSLPQVGLTALTDSLSRIPGEFKLVGLQWQFSGDDRILREIAAHGDSAVVKLVDCLDRADSALATVDRRRVPVGVVCYAALQRTAYAVEHEDGTGDWTGFVQPTATIEELRAAKEAWRQVVARKAFRLS